MTACVSKKTVSLIMACDLRSGAFASVNKKQSDL